MISFPSPVSGSFSLGADIVADCLRALLPKPPERVTDYVAAHRFLTNDGGGYVGRWSHDEAPYLIEPMDELTGDALTVAIAGPGQCGKTEIARNWLFTTALADPADMLWYSASEPLVVSEVKTQIAKMIVDHPDLRDRLTDNSLFFKRFGSMSVQFLAGIMGNMISKSAPRIFADEFDAICKSVPQAKELFDVRRQTFGARSKLVCASHPDLVEGFDVDNWNAGIMDLYRQSDRRIWYWQCPECGAFSSPNPIAARVMTIHYDDRAPEDEIMDMARLLCPVNGCLIEDNQRRAMNLTGRWIGLGQQIDQDGNITGAKVTRDVAGFWIVGAMSPFLLSGIGGLAAARVRAERKYAIENDRKAMAEVLSKQWGVPLAKDSATETIDATMIADRADAALTLGTVANGVRFITVMIDVQANRFELLARGWMENGRSVVVDFQKIDASPGTSGADWDWVLNFATDHAWPLADESGRGMKALIVGFDSAGVAGVTVNAYAAWNRLRARKAARLLGRIDGREAWTVLPMKGASSIQAPRLQIVRPDAARSDRFAAARGMIPLGVFNPNIFKDDLRDQISQGENDPWSIQFPAALRSEGAPHHWFEQLVAEDRKPNGRWERRRAGRPNEALDLLVGTHVLAFLVGVQRINWDQPPSWARPWTENPNVRDLTAQTESSVITQAPPAAQVTVQTDTKPKQWWEIAP
jgi:phage terminase large subunit GpA-like protein